MDMDTTAIIATEPEPPGYVNPLESSSRWYLVARAQAIRYAASLGFSIANRTDPPTPTHSREVWFDSTLSEWKGKQKIKVEIWNPPRMSVGPRAAVINFHGGGWILGQGTDDARWADAVMNQLDAVVFTVNYRLSPSYPFPTPIEDCVDAILQITSRAAEYGIDPKRIVLSGFSAGASSALSAWVIMQDPARWNYTFPTPAPHIRGLALFYPVLDWTIERPEKRLTCAKPELTLPRGLTDLIDASYVYPAIPRSERTDLRLSPGLMTDEMIEQLPPVHLCLCEYDMLLAEGMRFAQRIEQQKKEVSLRVVKGEKHAWDNPMPMAPKDSVITEYGEASQAIATWLGQECDTDSGSVSSKKSRRHRLPRPRHLKNMSFRSTRSIER